MRRAIYILVFMTGCLPSACRARAVIPAGAQSQSAPATFSPATPGGQNGTPAAQAIDGIVARIEDDVLTESELRELAAFQRLVDGHSKTRAELILELTDQWIVRGEAETAKYPEPTPADIDRAYAQLAGQFPSVEEFKKRAAAADLSEAGVRRMLQRQLYLSRFLDYRFRLSARVDEAQIKKYYDSEFVPQLKARQQAIPAMDDVEDTIREVLTLRAIGDNSQQWLEDTRARMKIDILSAEDRAAQKSSGGPRQ